MEGTQASAAIDILTNSYKQSQECQDTVRRVAEICAMVSYSLVLPSILIRLLILISRVGWGSGEEQETGKFC